MRPRALILFILVLLTYTDAHTQLVRGYGLELGVVAANQLWQYSGECELPNENRWGFTTVGSLEVLAIPILSALFEAQYTQKGMKEAIPITTESHPDGWA
jgi:hypothetical protein